MPEKAFFRYFFSFFLGENLFFSPTFAQIFAGTQTFSRAQNDFFSRVEVRISRVKNKEFSRVECFFLGHNFPEVSLYFLELFIYIKRIFIPVKRKVTRDIQIFIIFTCYP